MAEDFVSSFLSLIPEGGSALSTLFTAFVGPALNPDSSSTRDQVKAQVKNLVDTAVTDNELALLRSQMRGIEVAIASYSGIPPNTEEARDKIVAIQTEIEIASCAYIDQATTTLSKNGPLLLLPQIASLHLVDIAADIGSHRDALLIRLTAALP